MIYLFSERILEKDNVLFAKSSHDYNGIMKFDFVMTVYTTRSANQFPEPILLKPYFFLRDFKAILVFTVS
jgi:hypothetical protein